MRMLQSLSIALAAGLLSGCFVFDELDKADAMLDKASPSAAEARRKQKEQGATPAAVPAKSEPDGPGLTERLSGWWNKATTPAPKAPDPENVAVRCELPSGTQFMRKHDCQLRGGRVAGTPAEPRDG